MAVGCRKNGKAVKISLLTVFAEDTISYNSLTYKIRISNPNDKDLIFYFERKNRSIFDTSQNIAYENGGLFLFDSARLKKCKLLLPFNFPEEIIVKARNKIDLLFVSSCNDFIFSPHHEKSNFQFTKIIHDLIRENKLYGYKYKNYPVIEDSMPVTKDSSFKIEFRSAYISDVQ